MKKLLLASNDKIGRKLIQNLNNIKNLEIVIDSSSNLKRLFKLIWKGRLKLFLLLKMVFAEIFRKDFPIPNYQKIRNNDQLLKVIDKLKIDRVYLFRAGLIINKAALDSGVEFFNIHCAKLQGYGGLGAISKALRDKDYSQEATIHRVTERIDEGDVIAVQKYQLQPGLSYRENEHRAYEAGIKLAIKELTKY